MFVGYREVYLSRNKFGPTRRKMRENRFQSIARRGGEGGGGVSNAHEVKRHFVPSGQAKIFHPGCLEKIITDKAKTDRQLTFPITNL